MDKFEYNAAEPMPDIKEEPKDEHDLESGLVCEPELDHILVKEKPMDCDQEMDESEKNDTATPFVSTVKEEPFISTVKEEPLEEQEMPDSEPTKSRSVFIIQDDGGEGKKKGSGHHEYQSFVNQPYLARKKKPSAPTASLKLNKRVKTQSPLELFSKEVEEGIKKRFPELTENEVTKQIIERWMKMNKEEKEVYKNMVFNSTMKEKPFISTVKEEPFISTVKEEPFISTVNEEPYSEPAKSNKNGMLIPIPQETKISSTNVTRTKTTEALIMFGNKLPVNIEAVHDNVTYSCHQCEFKATLKGTLKKHIESIHDEVTYFCEYEAKCEFKSKEKVNLKTHIESVHLGNHGQIHTGTWYNGTINVIYTCNQCEYKTTKKGTLKKHIKSMHDNVIYFCEYDAECKYKSKGKGNLKAHIEAVHSSVTHSCDQCGFKTKWKSSLTTHITNNHDRVTLFCDQCDYKTTVARNLKRHKESVHERSSYSCDQCDYKTTRSNNVKRHKATVHDGVRYN